MSWSGAFSPHGGRCGLCAIDIPYQRLHRCLRRHIPRPAISDNWTAGPRCLSLCVFPVAFSQSALQRDGPQLNVDLVAADDVAQTFDESAFRRVPDDEDDAGLLSGGSAVVERLADGFGPLVAVVEFDGVVFGEAVNAGFVRQDVFGDAFAFAPGLLPVALGCVGGERQAKQDCRARDARSPRQLHSNVSFQSCLTALGVPSLPATATSQRRFSAVFE